MGQWHSIRLWHYFGQSRRFEDRNRRKQAAITKTRFKFGSNASPPVKLRLGFQQALRQPETDVEILTPVEFLRLDGFAP